MPNNQLRGQNGDTMATFEQRKSGWWQAKIRRKGYPPQSVTRPTKKEAEDWAKVIESEMVRGVFVSRSEAERTTLGDIIARYRREVQPTKRGGDRDEYRLRRLDEEFGAYSLASINPAQLAEYRDRRLKLLSPQSVVHELNLLSRLFKAAVIDWGIALPGGIPTSTVRKPKVANSRERRLLDGEEALLLDAIDRGRVTYLRPLVLLALETAARQSELLSLSWRDVDLKRRAARLRGIDGGDTKTGETSRDVPLSTTAVAILEGLKPKTKGKVKAGSTVVKLSGPVFSCTASSAKQAWEHAVKRARRLYEEDRTKALKAARKSDIAIATVLANDPMLLDLHFHDLRHEATSRLAEKLQMHELMKVTGHKGTKMLARYYHPRAEDLARKLG